MYCIKFGLKGLTQMIEVLEKSKAVRRLCYAVLLVILMFALQPVLVVLAGRL